MIIDSKDIYKTHNLSYYCWAEIKDGKIVELGDETGRDGGVLWSKTFESEGRLQGCLISLGRDFGMKFYEKVYSEAYEDALKLLPPVVTSVKIKNDGVTDALEKVKLARINLRLAEKKLNKAITKKLT